MPDAQPQFSAETPGDIPDDATLMRAVAQGDRTALGTLIRQHQQRVWNVAFRFSGRAEDADDLTQEAFLRLWRGAAAYKPTARLSTWLYRIVVNLWVDAQRKRARAPLPLPPEGPSSLDPPVLEADETAQRVQKAVGALPERQRVVLVLHRYEGLSLKEIHSATGWSPAAIESMLSRAYATLRENLREFFENSANIDRRPTPSRPFNPQEPL